jgi:hypothetical protein
LFDVLFPDDGVIGAGRHILSLDICGSGFLSCFMSSEVVVVLKKKSHMWRLKGPLWEYNIIGDIAHSRVVLLDTEPQKWKIPFQKTIFRRG